jgi:adenine-specific DNA-methyltransferase
MTIQKLRPTFTLTEDRLRQLQQVVPEAFADGKINWETLRDALGEVLEDETQEHFGLTWPGKREARRLAALPPQGTLVPAPGEGVDEETTHNLFIEGENLEVLKLLQKSYAGRVKMIYIDPPYNTGNDFIYEDDYSEPLEAYLKRTGQMDEAGRRLTTNTRASGRFHSKWPSMIYPRLLLARQLLREDGVIFVSIDDNEVHNLRQVMNEVFGEENFVACVIWHKVYSPRMDTVGFSVFHDYILAYAKSGDFIPNRLDFEQNEKQFTFIDKTTGKAYRRRSLRKEGKNSLRSDAPSAFFPLKAPDGTLVYPIKPNGIEGCWRWSKKKYENELSAGNVEWVRTAKGWEVYAKQYLSENATQPPVTIWHYEDVGHTHEASEEIAGLLSPRVFDTPKPVKLIRRILQIGTTANDDIVLDFFAGSCTTAHAVLAQNREDGGRRQFIMVQLPEPTPPDSEARKAGYATIADIGKERIRRVIRKMKEEQNGQLPLPAAEDGQPSPLDLGFKVLKLTRSHFKPWASLEPTDAQTLDSLFEQNASPLVDGWTREGLLTEILLLEGFPLDSQVIPLEGFGENALQRVHHAEVGHKLFVCLDKQIRPETVERLKAGEILGREDIFICLDSALTDEAKVVLDDRLRLKVI